MLHRVLVIGYGNTLRQDDGFGYQVARRLQEQPLEGVYSIACHQLTPELAEPLSQCQVAIFVDAKRGEPVGLVEWQVVSSPTSSALVHAIAPADLLWMAKALYGSAPTQAYLLTVRSIHFGYGEGLSPAVEQAIQQTITEISCKASEGFMHEEQAKQEHG